MSAVCIIPARGGSVRIPRKNIRLFHGRPIISYSIATARASNLFDEVYVSTEDTEIAEIADACGAKVIDRPPELAEIGVPDCGTQEVVRHALTRIAPCDYACCIYPCAPLLTPDDLKNAAKLTYEKPYNYVCADGIFYYGMALRFIREPDNFSYCLKIDDARFIDINTESDWLRAEQMRKFANEVSINI